MLIISPDQFLMVGTRYVWTQPRVVWAWAESMRALKSALATGQYKKLVLLVGPPGAGKSTWLAAHQEEGALYFDACFASRKSRTPILREGTQAGVPVEAVWLQTPVEVCLARNATRSEDRRIPDEVIHRMADALKNTPPKEEEGYTLRIA